MKKKRLLLRMVFDKARAELPEGSITSLAAFLNACFEEKFGYAKNERTFVRYYKSLVVDGRDYVIDGITLDQMSQYIGYKDFSHFAKEMAAGKDEDGKPLKVTVSDGENSVSSISDALSHIVINITNSPVFTLPQFITQHKNGFGVLGVLLLGGFMVNQAGYFKTAETVVPAENRPVIYRAVEENVQIEPERILSNSFSSDRAARPVVVVAQPRRKECMYWKEDHYEAAFCDEIITGTTLIALDDEQLQSLKKITLPDTLPVQNALGKVWYDKSDNHLEFFTGFGLHPVNGKTLKPITKHMIDRHIRPQ